MSRLAISSAAPNLADAAARLFQSAAQAQSAEEFLQQALPVAAHAAGAGFLAIVRGDKGRWRTLASFGPSRPLPGDLLADALDTEAPQAAGEWSAIPLEGLPGELVVAAGSSAGRGRGDDPLPALASWLASGLSSARQRQAERERVARLEAVLGIVAQWRQTQELDALLNQMAEASTRLLGAERASIFLWDRAGKTLVGRPALGVEGNELRIPEDTGIVGQVVRSGEPRRVDADIDAEQREVDRRVDRQLKFQTRTLLCVPLVGASGERFGAFEVLNKRSGNFTDDDQAALVELAGYAAVALENTQQYQQLLKSRNQMAAQAAQHVELIGQCPAIEALRSTVRRIAETDLAVLITGENGTGKEVAAQMLHYLSRRGNEPLVAVNCAAIAETLLESELFGHEKGAFTDAREARAGKFELADGGTLFLDEIGDMSLAGQAKLLRVLEEKLVIRVGGSQPIRTDVRVVAATNQNLAELVRARRFREDLFFRLSVVTLELPPLRSRGEDVVLLAEHFLRIFCARARRKTPKFTAAARKRLLGHSWPGNVRELRNLMERIAYLAPEEQEKLDAEDLNFILSPDGAAAEVMSLDAPLSEATRRFQTEYVKRHIDAARGNMTLAAERLGLHRSNLYRKMRQLGMAVTEE